MTPPDDALRRKLLQVAFQMPAVATMKSRKSSITNAFVNTLIPQAHPTPEEIEQALTILGMDIADVRCAYCGDKMTEWDHLRVLVVKQRPTGFIRVDKLARNDMGKIDRRRLPELMNKPLRGAPGTGL